MGEKTLHIIKKKWKQNVSKIEEKRTYQIGIREFHGAFDAKNWNWK